jgi:hypothetical protein
LASFSIRLNHSPNYLPKQAALSLGSIDPPTIPIESPTPLLTPCVPNM